MDSDDWLEDDAVTVLLELQLKHPDKFIAGSFFQAHTDGSNIVRHPFKARINTSGEHEALLSYEEVAAAMWGSIYSPSWGKLFRAGSGITFPEGIAYSEDAVFNLNYLYTTSGGCYTPKPVYNILNRSGSATHSRNIPLILTSQKAAYELMASNPGNTQVINEYLMLRAVSNMGISALLESGCRLTAEEVRMIRDTLRPYVRACLKSRKAGIVMKVRLMLGMYLPVRPAGMLNSVMMFLIKCLSKIKHAIIKS